MERLEVSGNGRDAKLRERRRRVEDVERETGSGEARSYRQDGRQGQCRVRERRC